MSGLLEQFIEYILNVAGGEFLNHEKTGFKEISIFKMGVTLQDSYIYLFGKGCYLQLAAGGWRMATGGW